MANGNGSTTTVQQIVADPDFGKLSAQDQQSVLAHFDTDFGKLSTNELLDVVTALQKSALARPDLAQPARYLAPPASAGTPQPVPNYTMQALNPPGGFTAQGQFLANTPPEQRNAMAVAGTVGLTPEAGYLAAPAITQAAQTPVGQELIESAVKGASGTLAGYSTYEVLKALKEK